MNESRKHRKNPKQRIFCRLGRASFVLVLFTLVVLLLPHRPLFEFVDSGGALSVRLPVGFAAKADEGKAHRKSLKKAIGSGNAKQVRRAMKSLSRLGGEENMKFVLKRVPGVARKDENIYWILVEYVVDFRDAEAMTALGEFLMSHSKSDLARDLVYALGKSQSRNATKALGPVALDGPDDLRGMATGKIGKIYSRGSVDLLIEIMKKEEKKYVDALAQSELIHVVNHALIGMTGQRIPPSSVNWEGWWSQNRKTAKIKPYTRKGGTDSDKPKTGTVIDDLDDREAKEFADYFGESSPLGVVVLTAKYKSPKNPERVRGRDFSFDHIEEVLGRMKVPHTVVRREKFKKFSLKHTGVLVLNCTQFHKFCICPDCKSDGSRNNRLSRCTGCNKHESWSPALKPAEIKKIEKFVKRGGYLFAEDWIVKEVVEKSFPSYVRSGHVIRHSELRDVDVLPGRGKATHPYLRRVFESEAVRRKKSKKRRGKLRFRWSVDDESWAFDILDENKVAVLLRSTELDDVAEGQGAVAVAFRPGKSVKTIGKPARRGQSRPGVVMAVLSHFGKQQSSRDERALQNIMYNFLVDAKQQARAMGIEEKVAKKKKKKKKKKDKDPLENVGGR